MWMNLPWSYWLGFVKGREDFWCMILQLFSELLYKAAHTKCGDSTQVSNNAVEMLNKRCPSDSFKRNSVIVAARSYGITILHSLRLDKLPFNSNKTQTTKIYTPLLYGCYSIYFEEPLISSTLIAEKQSQVCTG